MNPTWRMGGLTPSLEDVLVPGCVRKKKGEAPVKTLTDEERWEKYTHGGYLAKALERDQIDEAVDDCEKVLKTKRFDTIVFRGVSGMLVGPIVAHRLRKEVIVVRKSTTDYTHSHREAEGHVGAKRYIVLDDFISSGQTVKTIIKAVEDFVGTNVQLAGGMFYADATKPWLAPGALRNRIGKE